MFTDIEKNTGIPADSLEFLKKLRRTATERHIPLYGSLDLTHRCNLRCVHCYLGSHRKDGKKFSEEMSTTEVELVLQQAADAGCLFLLISGGEPLLRADFCEIYRFARELGFSITIFTNATLLNQDHLELFSEYPPFLVDVTLYGYTDRTYEAITGVAGSYERCLRGIHLMLDCGIRVGLKTVVLKSNAHEIAQIEQMAKRFGTSFRIDACIIPCLDGDQKPLKERTNPELAVNLEFADVHRFESYRDYYKTVKDIPFPDTLYQCAAGVLAFHIDPSGMLRPCFMVRTLKYDILSRGFCEAWDSAVKAISKLYADPSQPCQTCRARHLCGYCPGHSELEGNHDAPPRFLCDAAKIRLAMIEPS